MPLLIAIMSCFVSKVPVARIAQELGTPVYIYSAAVFRDHLQKIRRAFAELDPLVCYSVKGCGNINIIRMLAEQGSGFDIVSGGELFRVLQGGGSAEKVVFAGAGKTDAEITQAIEAGIGYFNIESEAELENLISLAGTMGKQVRAALRVNPDVDPKTHQHTTTGKKETKFGVDIERALNVFEQYGRDDYVKLTAVHIHIGSPINTVEPYVQAITKTLSLIEELRERGFTVDAIDLGGGFGADYTTGQAPTAVDYAQAIVPLLKGKGLRVILEPGRGISGNSGIMVTSVLYTKKGGEKNFVIVDAGMNDLIRPAFYNAFHFIWPVRVADEFVVAERRDPVSMPGLVTVDVVGPICETVDHLAKGRDLPPATRGDMLAVFTAGAYGFVMSSQYNARPRAAEVLVEGDGYRVIRKRETYDDLISLEQ